VIGQLGSLPRSRRGRIQAAVGIWTSLAPPRARSPLALPKRVQPRVTPSNGRYAYLSPAIFDGYVLQDIGLTRPSGPTPGLVTSWIAPAWTAGGETPTWKGRTPRSAHHSIVPPRNRLYVSIPHGAFVILEREDMPRPSWSRASTEPGPSPRRPPRVAHPLPAVGRNVPAGARQYVAAALPPVFAAFFCAVTSRGYPVRCRFASFQVGGHPTARRAEFTAATSRREVRGTENPVAGSPTPAHLTRHPPARARWPVSAPVRPERARVKQRRRLRTNPRP